MGRYRDGDSGFDFDATPQAADAEMFSVPGGQGLTDPRVVAKPTLIDLIWADVKQPRRAIPASIRLHWDGHPNKVGALLEQWRRVAGFDTPTVATLLEGAGEGTDIEGLSPMAAEFVALVQLAASIKQDGLINPITVIEEQSGRFVIESGERRWLAFHLINQILGGYDKIPAIKSDGVDFVWRQASENTARRQLNAIGMARQLALLIMAARAAREDSYKDYADLVQAGGSDRRYYAQVADGNVHRIPKGFGERIQGTMGLSMEQLSRYRSLLRLSDDEQVNDVLWLRADVEDWPEKSMREIRDTLPQGKVRELILSDRHYWNLNDLRTLAESVSLPRPVVAMPPRAESPHPPALSPSSPRDASQERGGDRPVFQRGMRVRSKTGLMGVVRGMQGGLVHVDFGESGSRLVSPLNLTEVKDDKSVAARPTHIAPGWAMQVRATGEVGVIKALLNTGILLDVAGNPAQYADDELLDLGMNFDEWLHQEMEEMRKGHPAGNQPQFEGGYVEYPPEDDGREFVSVSGKAHSPKQSPKLFDPNNSDFHWYLLERLKVPLNFLKLSGAVRAVEAVQNMSVADAQALRENNAVKDTLDEYHDALAAALQDVMGHFDEALGRVHNAAFDE